MNPVKDPKSCDVGHNLVNDVNTVLQKVNAVLQSIVPAEFDHLQRAMDVIKGHPPSARAHEGNPTPFPSIAVLSQRQTKTHYDRNGHLYMVDCIVTAGDYSGGEFRMPELGLTAEYGPGSLIIFRGRLFKHSVAPWSGPSRKCICLFTWQSVLRQCDTDFDPRAPPLVDLKVSSTPSRQQTEEDSGGRWFIM